MQHIYLFVFCFVFIVGVICTMGDLSTSMVVVSLITNFVVLFLCLRKMQSLKSSDAFTQTPAPEVTAEREQALGGVEPFVVTAASVPGTSPDPDEGMYTQDYMDNHSKVKDSYFTYPKANLCTSGNTIDDLNTHLARSRARDKQCTDGWVAKNANFYKSNYGTEFDESENARWWGRNEW